MTEPAANVKHHSSAAIMHLYHSIQKICCYFASSL